MSLKIYFCGSIRGGRQDGEIYAKLIEYLKKHGQVLSENVGHSNVLETGMLVAQHAQHFAPFIL